MSLPAEVLDQLRMHLLSELPRECCGFLLGDKQGGATNATLAVPVLNAEPGAGSFAIPDSEIDRVRDLARRVKLEVMALYHSHPGGHAMLSPTDAAALVHSEWPWLILTLSPTNGRLDTTWFAAGKPD